MDANIKTLRDALEWLDRSIREEADFDGEMTATHASQLGFIQSMLEKFPPRNCDVGTVDEQKARMSDWCHRTHCGDCPYCTKWCALSWANAPYEAAKEGGVE